MRFNNPLPSSRITFPTFKSNLKSPEVPSPVKAGLKSGLNTDNSNKSSLKARLIVSQVSSESSVKSVLLIKVSRYQELKESLESSLRTG